MTYPRRYDAAMSSVYPTVDESRHRLHCAGWSFGETWFGAVCQVDGSNGENRILATGMVQAVRGVVGLPHEKWTRG
jgi:hypothetical protein